MGKRLSAAAESVRHSVKARAEIPDFTDRTDEIGHLSGALRSMTEALWQRINTIESFAADVAHELKNPLTILVGNLGNDPEVRYSQSGSAITTISGTSGITRK